ncbi:unnamed protein product [Rotaria sp. Silwood2]|nr:unnamed protein product [Rotaria sp. Silwood2]CAF4526418.1 unnamed protein product [Rotaria sp. Silwood2]
MQNNIQRRIDNQRSVRVDRMGTNVYSSKDNKSMHKTLNGEFILYQMLLEQISNRKKELIFHQNSLTEYFKPENSNDQQVMKEFDKEYTPDKAIHWYTRETCIYKILNKALRTQCIDDIIPFGSFIRDLTKQLDDEHILFIKQLKTPIIKVYRGQHISKDEVNRLKSGIKGLISINSFLSTSTNRNKAIEFATGRPPSTNDLTSILFEIDVNINYLAKPYADIRRISAFPEEEEILFTVGSIFRIDNVSHDDKLNLWMANLILCSFDDADIKDFLSSLKKELNDQNEFVSIGNYFIHMLKYDLAEEHFKKILNQNLIEKDIDFAYCYYGLAQANIKHEYYDLAISNINKALSYLLNNSSLKNHSLVSSCYNDLGSIYAEQSNYQLALQYLDKALSTDDTNNVSKIFASLSNVHFKMSHYHIALEYIKKSLEYQIESEYPAIANTYSNMGKIYIAMNESEKASTVFDKAIEYQLKDLPDTHPDVSYTYNEIGLMFLDKNNYEKALEYMELALHLQSESVPNNHPDFAITYRNIANIYMKKGDLDKALTYYQKVLDNQLKTLPPNTPSVVETYQAIENIYRKKDDYEQVSIYSQKILDSQLERKKLGDKSISDTYKNIGDYNLKKNNLDKALYYYLDLLNNELKTKFPEDFSLIHIYETIGNIYYKKRILDQSILYYNRSLDCYFRKEPFDQSNIDEIYKKIGKIFLKKYDFDQTLLFYHNQTSQDRSLSTNKILDNIYFEKRHLEQCFHYYKKYLHKQRKTYSENDPILSDTYYILANISFERENFDNALKYSLSLLNNELNRKQIYDPSLENLFKAIGTIYFKQKNYDQSLIYFYKLLDCQLGKIPKNYSSIDDSYNMIGKIYLNKNYFHQFSNDYKELKKQSSITKSHTDNFLIEKRHLDQTLGYFQNLMYKQNNNQSLDDIYTILGNICLEKQDFNQALKYFQTLLDKRYQRNNFGDASVCKTYLIIGNIYAKISHMDQALQNYRQGLSVCERLPSIDRSIIHELKSRIRHLPCSRR